MGDQKTKSQGESAPKARLSADIEGHRPQRAAKRRADKAPNKPSDKAAGQPSDQQSDKAADKPTNIPANKAANKPSKKPAKKGLKKPPLTRSEIMARRKSQDTKPEMLVRRALWAAGYRYRLHDRRLPGRPDLSLRGLKAAIFVHGCFWHAHQDCPNFRPPKSRQDYWSPKLEKNAARDLEARRKLEADGWRVLTIWECQLAKEGWLEEVLAILNGLKDESLSPPKA
jgi:DNA mismatch endonuclease (patch repair protein)